MLSDKEIGIDVHFLHAVRTCDVDDGCCSVHGFR